MEPGTGSDGTNRVGIVVKHRVTHHFPSLLDQGEHA